MVNEILFGTKVITVGMPITYRINSDSYAGRVSKLLSSKRIEIELVNPGEDFVWETKVWTLRSRGWAEINTKFNYWHSISFGVAVQDLDPCF